MTFQLSINDHPICTITARGQQNTIDPTVVAAEIMAFFTTMQHLRLGPIIYMKSGRRWFIGHALIEGKQEVMNGFLEEVK